MRPWSGATALVNKPLAAVRGELGEAWAVARAVAAYRRSLVALSEATDPWPVSDGWTTPVALVHGAGHNGSAWARWEPGLHAAGFHRLVALEYRIGEQSVPALASDLGHRLERVCERAGTDRVHVVGHSLGGFALRVWHDLMGGDATIGVAASLGSPQRGLPWMHLPTTPRVFRDLASGSPLHRQLDAVKRPNHDRWTTIAGSRDRLIPPKYAGIHGSPTIVVPHIGHLGLLYSRSVAGQVIVELLAAEEAAAVQLVS